MLPQQIILQRAQPTARWVTAAILVMDFHPGQPHPIWALAGALVQLTIVAAPGAQNRRIPIARDHEIKLAQAHGWAPQDRRTFTEGVGTAV